MKIKQHQLFLLQKKKRSRLSAFFAGTMLVFSSILLPNAEGATETIVKPAVLAEIQKSSAVRVIIGLKVDGIKAEKPSAKPTATMKRMNTSSEGEVERNENDSPSEKEGLARKEKITQAQARFLKELGQKVKAEPASQPEMGMGTGMNMSASSDKETPQEIKSKKPTAVGKFTTIPYLVMDGITEQVLAKIEEIPYVTSVELDTLVPPIFNSASWNIGMIGADQAWAKGYAGAGQAVAILDTGVDKTHSALAGKVVEEACFSTTDAYYGATSVCPDGSGEQVGPDSAMPCDAPGCDHGTHVAGIVAGNGSEFQGVAKEANLIAIQVFSHFSSESLCGNNTPCMLSYTSDQLRGLEHVLGLQANGIEIAAVNMSLGGGEYADYCDDGQNSLKAIIDLLRMENIATVIASGNDGYPQAISSPACISSAISVGATDGFDEVAYYSNSSWVLNLLAPGSNIYSSVPGGEIASKSGTSMAAPAVAAAFAVLKSVGQVATVDQFLDILQKTGKPLSDWRNGFVKPRIQVGQAVDLLIPDLVLGIDMENQLWTRENLTDPAQPVADGGQVKRITMLPDGALLAVGLDNQLWVRTSLSDTCSWQLVPNSGFVKDVAMMPDGTTLLGVGLDNQLWIRATPTSQWKLVPNSGWVVGINIMPDGTILGIGADHQLWTRASLESAWQLVENSGQLIDIAVMDDGTLLGVGLDNQLWVRAAWAHPWEKVANSEPLTGIAVLK